jgi:hypothetical protein
LNEHRGEEIEPLATFSIPGGEDSIHLLDAQVKTEEGGIQVNTLWQAAEVPTQTTFFVHVVDAGGNLVAQADGDPLGGSYPLDQWQGELPVLDTRWLELAESSGLGLRIGLYDRLSGQRLDASGPEGEPYPEDAILLPTEKPFSHGNH